ncbi:RHS/YD repeat protein [Hyphomonas neptunium ATCC 15444]|uniref:RHS/YD repeat protein n=2 Tax=Hyphomonas TaxID=85 RepID=Q0BZ75_HYPNA|nr:RHS/YD repeat protein [Hyphomonas neptunium ATCC 15444]
MRTSVRNILAFRMLYASISLSAVAEVAAAQTVTYTYDALGRLTGADYPAGASTKYVYDAAGNRTSVVSIQSPIAVNDAISTNSNTSKSFDPRINDSDPQGGALTIVSVDGPPVGSAIITGGGTGITYAPPIGSIGLATFDYTIRNPQNATATARVTVTILNQGPVAVADSVTTAYNTPVTFNPLSNDYDREGDDKTLVSVSTPSSGSTSFNPAGPSITYTPANGFSGAATFTYVVADHEGAAGTGTVTVAVSPQANSPPVANNDILYFMLDNPGNTHFYGEIYGWRQNDYDPDAGDVIFLDSISGNSNFYILTSPSGGKTLRYSGAIGSGHQSVNYTIADSSGATDSARIDVYFYAD